MGMPHKGALSARHVIHDQSQWHLIYQVFMQYVLVDLHYYKCM
jgi:hypothetical protein